MKTEDYARIVRVKEKQDYGKMVVVAYHLYHRFINQQISFTSFELDVLNERISGHETVTG